MAENNNIKEFTAADIEKYWQGKLSAGEMHAIEKAAMDDPLLADALEGYKNTTSAVSDLNVLKEKLHRRVVAVAPVIVLKKKFTWLRVAAAIIIIAGLGLVVQQVVLNNKTEKSIVNVEKAKDNNADVATIDNEQKPDTTQATTPSVSDTSTLKAGEKKLDKGKTSIGTFALSVKDTTKKIDDRLAGDVKVENPKNDLESRSAPTIVTTQRREEAFSKKEARGRIAPDSNKSFNQPTASGVVKSKDADDAFYDVNKNAGNILSNKYNYRVVDAQNNPVPFANVTNTRDNVGTYTDIKGNFNLISSDSVLNVQIRSLGYNAANYKLVPSTQAGELVLKEDNEARKQTLAQNRKVVSNITRKDSAELEEPEVGWGNYNTYIANNIQIPDNIRAKNTRSDVELSFDIDKTGNPINIKVTKSSQCKECDEEAKRLLKEGPKWKRKGKKSKTTISIAVDQK